MRVSLSRCLRALAGVVVVGSLAAPGDALATRCTGELPVLLIVQDRSNSMWAPPTPLIVDAKWTIAQNVVPDIVSRFAGDFRYGLMLLPGDHASGSCTTGAMALNVGATPTQVHTAYLDTANGPSGATPTATSLRAAGAYLDSLGGTAPKHILLITDGVPNCNFALDPATCPCTSSGQCYAGVSTAGKYCLDDLDSQAAAGEVLAHGHKVFVVGFGSDVNADHNAVVLNGIANRGGTVQAYSASSQTALDASLQQVIAAARDCCNDACTNGQSACAPSGQARTVCGMGAEGCYVWSTQNCPPANVCTNGQCTACNTTCTAGATQCGASGALQTCVADATGCTSWRNGTCPPGSTCTSGTCQSCTSTCTAGRTECVGNGTRTCVADAQGCTRWGPTNACPSGTLCAAATGTCASCTTTCTAGARTCTDTFNSRTCVADASGCTSWTWQACPSGQTCTGGTCGNCNACTPGQTRCSGNVVQTCAADGQGCAGWQDTTTCAAPQYCDTHTGTCTSCPVSCTIGSHECSGADIHECVAGTNGCNQWRTTGTCAPPQVCLNAACCTNTCTLGATRCAANGSVERCEAQPSGCSGWSNFRACQAGTSCVDGDCLQNCVLSGEIDTCPAGFECTPDGPGLPAHCRPRPGADGGTTSSGGSTSSGGGSTSSGGGSTSSGGGSTSSGGGSTSSGGGSGTTSGGNGGVNGTGGAGNAEDDTTSTNCGCDTTGTRGVPFAAAWLLAGLAMVRRRRQ